MYMYMYIYMVAHVTLALMYETYIHSPFSVLSTSVSCQP